MYSTSLKGKVVHGKKLGRKIGYKTANIAFSKGKAEPGVYRVNVFFDGKKYAGAGNYMAGASIFEVHIFDFDEDIYQKEVEISILYKHRSNKKFDSLNDLKTAIESDITALKCKEIVALTFGTFDLVHPGHSYYLLGSSKISDYLVTVVARDISVLHFKGKLPYFSESIRLSDVKKLGISDEVILGAEKDYYACIKKYNPDLICLGYDQKSANIGLEKYREEKGLSFEIVILPPFKEEKFKSSLLKNNLL